jgi:23S rRNA (adenine2503-C2)-methyltransferase
MTKKNIKGLNLSELQAFVEELGEKKYRAVQLYSWLYAKAAQNFDEMTDISKDFRTVLSQISYISNLQLITQSVSADGTIKYLFKLNDDLAIESVLIPSIIKSSQEENRLTL